MYLESTVSLNFCILHFFFLIIVRQPLYVSPGCLKCVSGENVSLANKNLLTISLTLCFVLTLIPLKQKGTD